MTKCMGIIHRLSIIKNFDQKHNIPETEICLRNVIR
jgi:hypothetical protein